MSNSSIDKFKQTQRQGWDNVAVGWQKWWSTFEIGAQSISDKLVELANIKPGLKVLDVATGIGEPAITAALRVGNDGYVLATDLSSQMLSIAKERARLLNLDQIIEFKEGDAETIVLQQSFFDAALCRWGLMFFSDLSAGLYNIYQSLVDGGRFAAAVWSTSDKVPQLSIAMNIVCQQTNASLPPTGNSGPFGLSNEKLLYRTFENVGFKDIQLEKVIVTFQFDDAADYTKFTQDIAAPVNAMLVNQSEEHVKQIWNCITEKVASKYVINNGDRGNPRGRVSLDNEAICIVGTK